MASDYANFFFADHGKIIVSKYRSIRNSDSKIEERTLSIEAAWIKISQQLALLKLVEKLWERITKSFNGATERFR